jgi:hypothetical protein
VPLDADFWKRSGPTDARDALIETLRYELLGPLEPQEEIDESPLSRYLIGMLAPFGTLVAPEEDESLDSAGGTEEDVDSPDVGSDQAGEMEATPPMSQALSPSSIGMSCLVPGNVRRLVVTTRWGDYARLPEAKNEQENESPAEDADADKGDGTPDEGGKRKRRPPQRWKRTPVEATEIPVDLKAEKGLQRIRVRGDDEIYVEHVTRPIGNAVAVSLFLVNRRERPEQGRPPADTWIFQPALEASCHGDANFLPREPEPLSSATDADMESNALLFRNRREFAVGHGSAVTWKQHSSATATSIATSAQPQFELPQVQPQPIEGASFDMQELAEASDGEALARLLRPLVEAYQQWIKTKHEAIPHLPPDLQSTATDHLRLCDEAAKRVDGAIDLLRDDPVARQAFAFANTAMLLQRSHSEWASARQDDREHAPPSPTIAGAWRPFQLAFILLTLRGIADPRHDERRLGDLLWFPTGGGKTEAYLGLAAFTVALRRRRPAPGFRPDAGVAVLMRYTLRLLTIQQFQRASTLLCACEVIRRADEKTWGSRRFSIGLWLGRQATPNRHEDSRRALTRLRMDESDDRSNPCQLESCPWCGENLTRSDPKIWIDDGDAVRTRVFCPRAGCEFTRVAAEEGLPVVVVDEEIYRECPSLVIATVDKFAQMPWKGEVQALFGRVDRECSVCGFLTPDTKHPSTHKGGTVRPCERLAPPDLIIQDELHLISGPLGTMVGLYETAVDTLARRSEDGQVIAPKLVASTATIRRAFEQIKSLFDRELRVFPPLGLDPEDSFFAREVPPSTTTPGRMYLGVMAPGKSMKTALIRTSAALLSGGAGLSSDDPDLADPYLTLVAYFNSLRELGGAIRLMDDDIRARLDQLETRGLPRRNRPIYAEMTSRVSSSEIPRLLRQLKTPHNAPRTADSPLPLDAVLASNMISVGVDVNRLGLMTVLGQPKTTAEYIQATSRVGRQKTGPGLVVTIYNWVRPRDLSHLERFAHYHATLYRHIEAVSVTPFSSRARDRGLAGTFVAMHRLRGFLLAPEEAATKFDPASPEADLVQQEVLDRVADIIGDPDIIDEVRRELKSLRDEWGDLAHQALMYGWRHPIPEDHPPPSEVLMQPAEGGSYGHWRVPGSLREVEEPSLIYLKGVRAPAK